MATLYCSLEQIKRAVGINGRSRDPVVMRLIESNSRRIDQATRRIFIPKTQTRTFRWPQRQPSLGYILWLDFDLISVTTLQTKAQNTTPTTIVAADYFLEPANFAPPYDRIEIDQSSTAVFEGGDTSQRSISVAGSWGYRDDKRASGTVSSGLAASATATSMVCSDGSLIDVGNTLLIETEQVFVSDRSFAALGVILLDMVGNLASDKATVAVTVDAAHGIVAGETIRIDSEQMYVESVSGNILTVTRAYDGTVLASHTDNTAIHINRTLTVERAINGTTGATHADATAINVYEPPFDINEWCVAETIAAYLQEGAGWGRTIGQGDGAMEFGARDLAGLRKEMTARYQRVRIGVV